MMYKLTWFFILLMYCSTPISSLLVWKMGKTNLTEDEIEIAYIKNETRKASDPLDLYSHITRALKNHTLDEKCQKGLSFGLGFQWYNPYVHVGQRGRKTTVSGIFPHVVKNMMKACCPKASIDYGRLFPGIEEIDNTAQDGGDIDIYFPLYAQNGKESNSYKDYPFIPIVTAPKIVVLVPERLYTQINPRMGVLVTTILGSWPLLIFTTVSTMLAGLIVWFLDRKWNAQEFPPTFYQGAWEGIWWAFVTMTTVGYGDRSPRSPYARAFCIMWILVGIVMISLFTGLITSALSASSTPVFNLPGSAIGAIYGSIEYQVGVGNNADMKVFKHHPEMFTALVKETNMHGVMIDNFILSASEKLFKEDIRVRMERELDVPITYGLSLGEKGKRSQKTYKCFKRYADHHQHQIFEIVAKKLRPIKNPTDQVRLEVAASEKFFYEDSLFKTVVFTELGVLIIFFIFGFLSEKWASAKLPGFYHKLRGTQAKDKNSKLDDCSLNEVKMGMMDDNLYSSQHDKPNGVISGGKPPPILSSTSHHTTY